MAGLRKVLEKISSGERADTDKTTQYSGCENSPPPPLMRKGSDKGPSRYDVRNVLGVLDPSTLTT